MSADNTVLFVQVFGKVTVAAPVTVPVVKKTFMKVILPIVIYVPFHAVHVPQPVTLDAVPNDVHAEVDTVLTVAALPVQEPDEPEQLPVTLPVNAPVNVVACTLAAGVVLPK
jgi:hypothetical protein